VSGSLKLSASRNPIGVFDSGLGGLTVVKQIRRLLPNEDIIYIGDLAYLPYGNKSQRQIQERSLACAKFLLQKKAKTIVIACNSASAYAYPYVKSRVKESVMNVIDAVVEDAVRFTQNKRIGVIATQATVQSLSYEKKLLRAGEKLSFFLRACPLFVPLVEEGEIQGPVVESVAAKYLQPFKSKKVDTLILGCTHYPLIRGVIQREMGNRVTLVDSAEPTAFKLKKLLFKENLIAKRKGSGSLKVYVTDHGRNFVKIGSKFLGEEIKSFKLVRV